MVLVRSGLSAAAAAALMTTPAAAEWQPATPAVAAAAKQPEIATVLAAVNKLDASLIDDDHAVFAALLAPDLVVNNPQNGISEPGATAQRNAGGKISYVSYRRSIEFAGMRNGMVILMGEETVIPKLPNPFTGKKMKRRFTDIWRQDRDGWRLAIRQATIISPH